MTDDESKQKLATMTRIMIETRREGIRRLGLTVIVVTDRATEEAIGEIGFDASRVNNHDLNNYRLVVEAGEVIDADELEFLGIEASREVILSVLKDEEHA